MSKVHGREAMNSSAFARHSEYTSWAKEHGWFPLIMRETDEGKNTRHVTPDGQQFYAKFDQEGLLVDFVQLKAEQPTPYRISNPGRVLPTPAQRPQLPTSTAISRTGAAFLRPPLPTPIKAAQEPPKV